MSTVVCSYFARGSCRFGNRCWNSHDLGSSTRPYSPFIQSESTDDDDEETYPRLLSVPVQTTSPSSSTSRTRHNRPSNSAQKSQPKQTEPQFVWSLTNKISGEIREGSPDSLLVETVKKLNDAENLVSTLRQELRSKNEGDNFSWIEHQMEQSVENDLQCNICYEMFIKPTVLNCSHTFCHECIESWTRRVNHCPTCRVYVKNKSYCLTLDSFLDKISECLPDDMKSRRESLKIDRNNSDRAAENGGRIRRNNARRRNRSQSLRRTLGVLWGERDRDGAEWNISLEEALFDPIRLGDVLGRNRNDREDNSWEDNFSDTSTERYSFCSYCDNIGHTTSNCPISIMEEESDDQW